MSYPKYLYNLSMLDSLFFVLSTITYFARVDRLQLLERFNGGSVSYIEIFS